MSDEARSDATNEPRLLADLTSAGFTERQARQIVDAIVTAEREEAQ